MPGKRKTSNVWQHFSLTSFNKVAVCKHCEQEMSYCGSTGNLLKHIKAKHVFVDLSGQSRSGGGDAATGCTSDSAPKQRKLTPITETPGETPERSKKITELIINTVVGDLMPINLAEGKNFKKLINELTPGYKIPSRQTITRNIEEKFRSSKVEIRKLLSHAKYASLTTDLWCNVKMHSFLGVTIHFINENFKLVNLVLATKEINGVHSGRNITACLEAVLEDYELSPYQIVGIVSDNDANIVNACDKLKEKYGWIHVRCAAHTLELCFKEAFDIPQVESAIGTYYLLLVHSDY